MEAYSNSNFTPMSILLDHLKTPAPGEQSYLKRKKGAWEYYLLFTFENL